MRADSRAYASQFVIIGGKSGQTTLDGKRVQALSNAGATAINVADYGAKGDAKIIYDAAITATLYVLTSATARFLPNDAGKVIRIEGAGAAGAALATTIAAFISSSQVRLVAAASTTISSKRAWWGTDDTQAIQNAVSSMQFSNAASNGSAVLSFGDGLGTPKSYLITDTIDFGSNLQYATIHGYGNPSISGESSAIGLIYHGTEIRWAGADGTGKPMFWFKAGAYASLIQRLGFYGGDEAIRFRRLTDGVDQGTMARNRVLECSFDDQQVASIQWGFPTSDTNVNQDDIDGLLIQRCWIYRSLGKLGEGIVINNYPGNGYGPVTIDHLYTSLPGTLRHIRMRGIYNIALTNLVLHASTATDGTYAIDLSGAAAATNGGWLDFRNCHFELPYILKTQYWSNGPDILYGLNVKNIIVNYTTANAFGDVALDLSGAYAIVENVHLSQIPIIRKIKFGVFGGSINNPRSATVYQDAIQIASGHPVSIIGDSPDSFVPVAFAATNFASSAGTWVVASGDQTTFDYMRIGHKMTINAQIDTSTITGTPAYLLLTLPAGVTASRFATIPFAYSNNGGTWATGTVRSTPNSAQLQLYAAGLAVWVNGADNNSIHVMADIPIN